MVEGAQESPDRIRHRRGFARIGSPIAWAATVVFAALMVVWSVTTPQFRNPDEPQHVDSVLRLMDGGGWPAPAHAVVSPEVIRARTLSGFSAIDGQQGPWGGATLLPGVERTLPPDQLKYFSLYSAHPVTPPDQRAPFSKLHVTRTINPSRNIDQMTQHPPLYYAVEAGVLKVVGADHLRYDRQLELMRLLGVLMVTPLPLFAYSVARRLTGRRRVGDLASVLPLGVPQLAAMGAAVSNDTLVITFGAILVLEMAIMLTRGASWRLSLGTGLTLGLALLTKGTLLLAVPVVGLALVVGARRRAPRQPWGAVAGRLAAMWGLAFAVGGWWWTVNIVRYGTLQPNGLAPLQHGVSGPRLSPVGFVKPFVTKLATSFWGNFGWLEIALRPAVVVTLTVLLIVAMLLAFRRRATAATTGILLLFPLLTLVVLYKTDYAGHLKLGLFPGIQGRYLFGAIIAIVAAAAVGVAGLAPERSRRERWLPVAALLGALVVAAYGLWVAFRGYYQENGWTLRDAWARMLAWSPFPRWFTVGLVLGLVVVGVVALGVAVQQAFRRDRAQMPPAAAATPAGTGPGASVPVGPQDLQEERALAATGRQTTYFDICRRSGRLRTSPA